MSVASRSARSSRRRLAGSGLGEAEKQPPGVTIGGDGMGTGLSLADETLGEVGLEGGGERAHERLLSGSRRPAARESNSGRPTDTSKCGRVRMAEEGGQQGHVSIDIDARPVPADQRLDGEAMTEVIQMRGRRSRRARGDAGPAQQASEGPIDVTVSESVPCWTRRSSPIAAQASASRCAVALSAWTVLGWRGTSRLLPNLVPIPQQAVVPVDVVTVEPQRLADRRPVATISPIRVS